MVIFHSKLLVYQRVYVHEMTIKNMEKYGTYMENIWNYITEW